MPNDSHIPRLRALVIAAALFWVILAGNLFRIQVLRGAEYAEDARGQHERRKALEAMRGRVLDRNGEELAINLRSSSFAADPARVDEPALVSRRVSRLTGRSQPGLLRTLQSQGSFVWVARKTEPDVAQAMRAWGHPALWEIIETVRWYPFGSLAGQVVGFTNVDNRGIEGAELSFNDRLNGRPGWHTVSVDGRGYVLANAASPDCVPEHGDNVVLTIDTRYQQILEEELEQAVGSFRAESGMGVLVHPKTGEILAMANVPLCDPNRVWEYKRELRKNRTVTDVYEPGSVFKIVTAAAVIEEGAMDSSTVIFCENGRMKVAGGVIHDSHPYDSLTFRQVIKHSSNIGTIKAARRVGGGAVYKHARLFGFGTKTGVRLPGEVPGMLSHPSRWSRRSLDTIAMGHEISATALQLAVAYSAVANGGLLMRPKIVQSVLRPSGTLVYRSEPEVVRRVISEETAHVLVDMLIDVVQGGTGVNAHIEGVEIGAKTGTAQRVRENGRGYSDDFISTFAGFLPARDPELVCVVVLDSPKEAHFSSQVAAPTFRRIMQRILALKDPPVRFYRQDTVAEIPGARVLLSSTETG